MHLVELLQEAGGLFDEVSFHALLVRLLGLLALPQLRQNGRQLGVLCRGRRVLGGHTHTVST